MRQFGLTSRDTARLQRLVDDEYKKWDRNYGWRYRLLNNNR